MHPNHVKGTPNTRNPRPAYNQFRQKGIYSKENAKEIDEETDEEICCADVQPETFLGFVDVTRGVSHKIRKTAAFH